MHDPAIEDALASHGRKLLADRAPAWEAFAAGELSEAEVIAARREHESEAELHEHLEMFRPFSADERDNLVAKLLTLPGEKHVPAPSLPTAKVIPLWRRPMAWASVAAAAAVAFLLVQPIRGPSPQSQGSLPTFELEVNGGLATQRSEGKVTGVPKYAADTEIEVVIRPQVRAKHPLAAKLFAFNGEQGQLLSTPIEVADSGSVRLKGQVGEVLKLAPGTWRLVFVVGATEALPTSPGAVKALESHTLHAGPGGDFWVESMTLDITSP